MHDAALDASIALSAVIAPSRRLRALLLGAALVHAGAAAWVATGAVAVALPWLVTAGNCAASLLCTMAAARPSNLHRIDISKAGALRLTVQQKLPESGRAVRLLPGSLLWGHLLVLRFGSLDDATAPPQTVLVLPDSLAYGSFRALAVAMRAIGGHGSTDVGQKIP